MFLKYWKERLKIIRYIRAQMTPKNMTDMTVDIAQLKDELTGLVATAGDLQALEADRVAALGKKGRITDLMKNLGQMDPGERKKTGQALNLLKDEIAALIEKQETALKKQ